MSLVGWWPLHRTFGNAIDLSGNGNDGTINGASRGVAGRGGLQAFSFDGTDDYIDVGNQQAFNSYSISAWLKFPSGTAGRAIGITANNYILIGVNSGDWRVFHAASTNVDLRTLATAGDWTHVVATWDGSIVRAYTDGSEYGNGSASGLTDKAADDLLGAADTGSGPANYWPGDIADVRIYNRALSPQEVQQLYEYGVVDIAEPAGNNEGGVSRYTLDGTSATDSWGSNDGTLNGGITTGVDGVRNEAFSFDGTDDWINIPDQSQFSAYTVSCWVKHDSPSDADNDRAIVLRGNNGIVLGNAGGGTFEYLHQDGSGTFQTIASPSIGTDWNHHAQTWDGSTVVAYKNGEIVGSASYSGIGGGGSLGDTIAASDEASPSSFLAGDMDDIRIYDRALSAAEIHEIYRHGTRGRDMRKLLVNQK